MKNFWDKIFPLDEERSIWVEEEELGAEKSLYHHHKNYFVKIPQKINKQITLRLRGMGKKRGEKTGDLFVYVWLNQGEDVNKSLWLSETSAKNGTDKRLLLDDKTITMVIPPKSHDGLILRLKGYGRALSYTRNAPVSHRKRGNLFVKLLVYPDNITPQYGSFDSLSTDNMVLEGWVYKRFDEVIHKTGEASFHVKPLKADTVTNLFNELGWRSIYQALVDHLKLTDFKIELATSSPGSLPGSCQKTIIAQKEDGEVEYSYKITINEQFLDNPFSVTAILAHELCHVVSSEKVEPKPKHAGYRLRSEKGTLEDERTIDLLVFMFKIGEFQLRVARDKRLTLGYFNQEIFERIQVIVSRKLNSL